MMDWVAMPPTAIMARRPLRSSETFFFSMPAASLGANWVPKEKSGSVLIGIGEREGKWEIRNVRER